ncbi:hypothetical protein [uncultured Microbacterium sp.]|nr:hypothetical protein [uncultured Microbacterium sp.]
MSTMSTTPIGECRYTMTPNGGGEATTGKRRERRGQTLCLRDDPGGEVDERLGDLAGGMPVGVVIT